MSLKDLVVQATKTYKLSSGSRTAIFNRLQTTPESNLPHVILDYMKKPDLTGTTFAKNIISVLAQLVLVMKDKTKIEQAKSEIALLEKAGHDYIKSSWSLALKGQAGLEAEYARFVTEIKDYLVLISSPSKTEYVVANSKKPAAEVFSDSTEQKKWKEIAESQELKLQETLAQHDLEKSQLFQEIQTLHLELDKTVKFNREAKELIDKFYDELKQTTEENKLLKLKLNLSIEAEVNDQLHSYIMTGLQAEEEFEQNYNSIKNNLGTLPKEQVAEIEKLYDVLSGLFTRLIKNKINPSGEKCELPDPVFVDQVLKRLSTMMTSINFGPRRPFGMGIYGARPAMRMFFPQKNFYLKASAILELLKPEKTALLDNLTKHDFDIYEKSFKSLIKQQNEKDFARHFDTKPLFIPTAKLSLS